MWNRLAIGVVLFMTIFSGCAVKKTTKTSETAKKEVSRLEKKQIISSLEMNRLHYSSYSGKANTNLTVNNKSFNATMNLRIKHDEAIWVSVTIFMGIEAARILITPDRIKVINRIQGEYIDKPFEYIYNFTSTELGFEEIEDLLVGNTLKFVIDPQSNYFNTALGIEAIGIKQDLDFTMQFGSDYRVKNARLSEKDKNQTFMATYQEFKSIMDQVIPQRVQIGLRAPKLKLDADLKFNTISLNEELNFPFSIPSGFKSSN